MKIYISGQITGKDPVEVREAFQQAAQQLRAANHTTVNPLENGLPDDATWEQHMIKDIELLLACDGIYRLQGWEQSDGAQIENYIAEKRGLEIIDQPAVLAYDPKR
ncbi:MAG: DUF4406 domain-containing protein [Bacteroides sp.]|nr:DUF4406 domain-containing protein [Bacteroides sp.]